MENEARLANLMRAEAQVQFLFDMIEARSLVASGRSERDVEQDVYALAEREFGVTKHWHKRICRSGPNTLSIASDNPPIRIIGADDIVYLDLGPVFDDWEADIGRSYVLGDDPTKQRLCDHLPRVFTALEQHFNNHPDITGAELFAQTAAGTLSFERRIVPAAIFSAVGKSRDWLFSDLRQK